MEDARAADAASRPVKDVLRCTVPPEARRRRRRAASARPSPAARDPRGADARGPAHRVAARALSGGGVAQRRLARYATWRETETVLRGVAHGRRGRPVRVLAHTGGARAAAAAHRRPAPLASPRAPDGCRVAPSERAACGAARARSPDTDRSVTHVATRPPCASSGIAGRAHTSAVRSCRSSATPPRKASVAVMRWWLPLVGCETSITMRSWWKDARAREAEGGLPDGYRRTTCRASAEGGRTACRRAIPPTRWTASCRPTPWSPEPHSSSHRCWCRCSSGRNTSPSRTR